MIHMKLNARPYVMQARAQQAADTRRRIVDGAVAILWGKRADDVTLADIARKAGVAVQTVLRVFGDREALLEVVWDAMRDRIMQRREEPSPGDVDGTLRALFDHYEELGDFVIRSLADEHRLPGLTSWLARGRRAHRRSMERQFAPWTAACSTTVARRTLVDALVVACDVYTWKLLRRDMGLSRREAEARMRFIVRSLLGGGRHGDVLVHDVGRRRKRGAGGRGRAIAARARPSLRVRRL
jgi:AcrR family transcriptional regulator